MAVVMSTRKVTQFYNKEFYSRRCSAVKNKESTGKMKMSSVKNLGVYEHFLRNY